jgi:hypothetical protein
MTTLRLATIAAITLLSSAAFAGGSQVGVLTAPNGQTMALGVGAARVTVGPNGAVTSQQNGSTFNNLSAMQFGPRNSLIATQRSRGDNNVQAIQRGPNNGFGANQQSVFGRNRVNLDQR